MGEKRNPFPSTSEALGKQRMLPAAATAARVASYVQIPNEPYIEVSQGDAPLSRFAVVTSPCCPFFAAIAHLAESLRIR